MSDAHIPVLANAVLDALLPSKGSQPERAIDGTLGAGGHTRMLIEAGVGHVLSFDLDLMAIRIAQENLKGLEARVTVAHASYADMIEEAALLGWDGVDAILLDLGISSMQIDTPERGFAFMHDGPLDMRFDASSNGLTAADIVNHWDAASLADIFFKYGEERHSRRIAKRIVEERPFASTNELAQVIRQAMPRTKGKQSIHPATRVFQALRIAVNDELRTVERVLPDAIELLNPGGRLAVISFHSLEDRIVKHAFKEASTEIVSPPGMVLEEKAAEVKLITRKPIVADDDEISRNPRSRSAKLRVVEKL